MESNQAEELIGKWIEWLQEWYEEDLKETMKDVPPDGPAPYMPPRIERDYVLNYHENRLEADDRTVLFLDVGVDDELGGATLLGVWDEGTLVYATACTDTDWAEFYRGSYPVGMVDMTQPYARKGQWLNLTSSSTPSKED